MKQKIIVPILMMLMMVGFASAGLEIFSSSPVQFTQNDVDLGQAYLIGAVENGGSEKLYFSNLPIPQGYSIKNTQGYITGTPSNVYVSYPYTASRELWTMTIYNSGQTKWFLLGGSDAQNWCNGLTNGAGIAAKKPDLFAAQGTGYYYCFGPTKVGTVGEVNGYEYKWTETFNIFNSLTNENFAMILNDQALSGSYIYSQNKQVLIRYSFSGLNVNSYIPDLSSKYSVIYQDAKLKVIERLPTTIMSGYSSSYAVTDTFLRNWLSSAAYQCYVVEGKSSTCIQSTNNPVNARDLIGNQITIWTTPKSISESGWTPTYDAAVSSSGRINLKRSIGGMPISPVFSIKLDAEWVGVYQPVTKPVIVSFGPEKATYLEGDFSARFVSEVRNDGSVDGSINYELKCSPTSVSIGSNPTQTILKGQTLTQYHNVQANTAGENVKASCCLTVTDRSNPLIKAGPTCKDVTFLEQNQCPVGMVAGSTQCSSDGQIMQCKANTDGVLVLQGSGTFCQYGCSMSATQAVCLQKPGCNDVYKAGGSCGDKICEAFEKKGQDCACLDDCSTCGDAYCSKSEQESKSCTQDCGVEERCGDGICSQAEFNSGSCNKDCGSIPINWTFIIMGVLGAGGIGWAIWYRLKKR